MKGVGLVPTGSGYSSLGSDRGSPGLILNEGGQEENGLYLGAAITGSVTTPRSTGPRAGGVIKFVYRRRRERGADGNLKGESQLTPGVLGVRREST